MNHQEEEEGEWEQELSTFVAHRLILLFGRADLLRFPSSSLSRRRCMSSLSFGTRSVNHLHLPIYLLEAFPVKTCGPEELW